MIKRRIIKSFILPLSALIIFSLSGCSGSVEKYEYTGFAMGTVLNATIYTTGEDITADLETAIHEVENDYISWKVDGSDIDKLNNAKAGEATKVSNQTVSYLSQALEISKLSSGAFDPTIGKLSRLWDFDDAKDEVPDADEIEELLKDVGYSNIYIYDNSVTLDKDTGIDLGAAGKGIGCDEAASLLQSNTEISGAIVTLGGSSVMTYGEKPDGSSWQVGIRDPRDSDEILGTIDVEGTKFIGTSGDYEKYFIEDGIRYHHILDPQTGYSANSGLMSTTIVCDSGLDSDALSTACFVLGKDKAFELLEKYGGEGILVDTNKKVYITDGIKDNFTLKNDKYEIAEY